MIDPLKDPFKLSGMYWLNFRRYMAAPSGPSCSHKTFEYLLTWFNFICEEHIDSSQRLHVSVDTGTVIISRIIL